MEQAILTKIIFSRITVYNLFENTRVHIGHHVLSNRLFKPFLVSKIEKFGIVGKRSSFILYESYKIGREKISNPKKFYGSKGGSSFYDIAGSTIIFNPFEHMFMNQNL